MPNYSKSAKTAGKCSEGVSRSWLRRLTAVVVMAAFCSVIPAVAQVDPNSVYGAHGVSPLAVKQGVLGTCFFHASIAELAKVAPDTLRADILPNPGGGYLVHFAQGPDETVFPEDVEFGRSHSYDRSEGTWVLVLMRGYAQRVLRQSLVHAVQQSSLIPIFVKPIALAWLDESGLLLVAYDRAIRTVVRQDGELDKAALKVQLGEQMKVIGIPKEQAAQLASYLDEKGFFDSLTHAVQQNGEVFGAYKTISVGQIPVSVIQAFLGAADARQVKNTEKLMEELRLLHAGGVAVVAGTSIGEPAPGFAAQNKKWWVPSHAYSVLDYDEAAQTVTVRNPWGSLPDPDGITTIPLALFQQGYDGFSYSRAATP